MAAHNRPLYGIAIVGASVAVAGAWLIIEFRALRAEPEMSKQLTRSELEALVGFHVPPTASDFRWRNLEPGTLDDHTIVSFTVAPSEVGAVLEGLPCTPSPSGSLKKWSELERPPLSGGELACTRFLHEQRWWQVRVSPQGARFKISVEEYSGY